MNRIAATLLTLALAMPYRVRVPVWVFGSLSVFDLAILILTPLLLVAHLQRDGRLAVGSKRLFALLSLPFLIGCLSLAWTENLTVSLKYLVSFAEALFAYLLAVNVFSALRIDATARAVGWMVLLLLTGSALSYLNVPGFDPERIYDLEEWQPAFLASYYSRLSHPFIGLSNAFAGVLSFFVFLLWGYGRVTGKRAFVFLAGLTFFAILATLSRGAILAVLVSSVLFIVLLGMQLRLSIARIAVLSLLVMTLLGFLTFAVMDRDLVGYDLNAIETLQSRADATNITYRLETLKVAVEKIAEAPWLGFGAGVTGDNSELLRSGTHNTYVEQMLNYGIPFGFLLCVSFALVMLHFFALGRLSPTQAIISTGVGIAILSQLLIFLTQASFEGYLLKVIYYFSIGIGMAMVKGCQPANRAPSVVQEQMSPA